MSGRTITALWIDGCEQRTRAAARCWPIALAFRPKLHGLLKSTEVFGQLTLGTLAASNSGIPPTPQERSHPNDATT